MKKHSALLILLLIAAITAVSAQDGKHFLWELNSGNSKVYLLGSIHAGKEELYPLPEVIEKAYSDSKYLAVEADISKADPAELISRMYYTDDTMLKDKVSPEVYAQLKAMFDEYGLPAIAYEKLRPWAAAMMASQLDVQAEGYAGEQGIDLYFMNKAAGEGKEILELESVSDQIKIFENMEEIFGNSFLEYTLQDMKDTTDQIGEFFKVWKNGDTKKFEELYNESIKDFPNKEKFDKYLMIDRNYKMAEKIDAFIKRGGTYFVVVGAGHLIGPESVVKLLEKKNYKLKQL